MNNHNIFKLYSFYLLKFGQFYVFSQTSINHLIFFINKKTNVKFKPVDFAIAIEKGY